MIDSRLDEEARQAGRLAIVPYERFILSCIIGFEEAYSSVVLRHCPNRDRSVVRGIAMLAWATDEVVNETNRLGPFSDFTIDSFMVHDAYLKMVVLPRFSLRDLKEVAARQSSSRSVIMGQSVAQKSPDSELNQRFIQTIGDEMAPRIRTIANMRAFEQAGVMEALPLPLDLRALIACFVSSAFGMHASKRPRSIQTLKQLFKR